MVERPEDYNCNDHEREFVEMIKSGVIEKLDDWVGQTRDVSDIGFLLTESENVNGSWYCNTWRAEQDLSWFFSVFTKYQEWWIFNYGEPLEMTNGDGYFESERIHCCMMIDAYRNVFDRAYQKLANDSEVYHWDGDLEITEDFIEDLKKTIDEEIFNIEDIF